MRSSASGSRPRSTIQSNSGMRRTLRRFRTAPSSFGPTLRVWLPNISGSLFLDRSRLRSKSRLADSPLTFMGTRCEASARNAEFLQYRPIDSPWYAFARIIAEPTRTARGLERSSKAAHSYRKTRVDRLTAALLFMGLGANVLVLLNDNIRWLLPTLGLVLTLVLPSRLLSRGLKGQIRGPGIRIPLALSLTVLALMIGGLLLNTVLPWVGDSHPLSAVPILCLVDVINLAIIALRPRSLRIDGLGHRRLGPLETWLVGLTLLSVLLAVFGAVRLNNGAGGGLAEIALSVAMVIAIALMISAGRIRPGVLLLCLYGIALTVLYMTSLRGWYTTGHDIQNEFRVFSLVNKSQRWSVSQGDTTYDTCLSITILPQLLWEMTRVATPYVFKVDFPLMFAACPVALYELSRRVFSKRLAIASALIFISFPTFVNDIVFLNRQKLPFCMWRSFWVWFFVEAETSSCGES